MTECSKCGEYNVTVPDVINDLCVEVCAGGCV